jgi:hypothetical protein
MLGMDSSLVDQIDFHRSIQRIRTDVKTDFISAPHLNAIYEYAFDFLISQITKGCA